MKDYKDVARSVFRRRNEYLEEKKRKREAFMKRSAVALSCCLMVLVSFNIWRSDALKTLAPSPDGSQFNVTEENTTAPPTTDENGMTAIPEPTQAYVTTALTQDGNASAHNGTTASGDQSHTVTTTRTKSGTKPALTTDSFMEVTRVRRTTAAATTAYKTSTIKAGTTKATTGAAATQPTTSANAKTTTAAAKTTTSGGGKVTTTTAKTTATTQRTTSRPYTTTIRTTSQYYTTNTRPVQTTSAVYSTTRSYTTTARPTSTTRHTTSVHYTTSKVYTTTSYSDINPIATVGPEPIAATTTTTSTTTVAYTYTTTTTTTGFNYNGNYYKPTGERLLNEYLDSFGHLISTEYNEDTGKYYDIYQYKNIDPNFMCYAYTEGTYAYYGINEAWNPKNFGELLDGIDAESNMKITDFYDVSANERHSLFFVSTVYELLYQYRDKELEITGLSYGARSMMLQNSGKNAPELDLSNKLGYIPVRVPYTLSGKTPYLQQGYIHITNDGKLEVDLFYFKYTLDIGKEDAEELVNKLKTL